MTVSDGTATTSKSFLLTVTAENDRPTVTDIPDQDDGGRHGKGSGSRLPSATWRRRRVHPKCVTAASDNQALLPNANLILGGSGANRTLLLTPAPNQSGMTTVTVTVSDGTDSTSDTFVLTVTGRLVSLGQALTGTPEQDTVEIAPGPNAGEWLFTINSIPYVVGGANVSVTFDGLGGGDTVRFIGSSGADRATIRADQAQFDGPGYSMSLTNIGATDYDGAGGQDTVTIWGSRGQNDYRAHPGWSEMTGDNVSIIASAETIYARGYGGGDTVSFTDSDGDEHAGVFSHWARMRGGLLSPRPRGSRRKPMPSWGKTALDRVIVRGSNSERLPESQSVQRELAGFRGTFLERHRQRVAHRQRVRHDHRFIRGGGLLDQLLLNDTPAADTFDLGRQEANLLTVADYGVTVATRGFGTVELKRTNASGPTRSICSIRSGRTTMIRWWAIPSRWS